MTFETTYNKTYKKLLILPAVLIILSLAYLIFFYAQTGDIINKDVSLTGGTTITLFVDISAEQIETELLESMQDFSIRTISDNSGKQLQVVITVPEEQTENLEFSLEQIVGQLTSENSSKESTSSSLGQDFFKQLIVAVLLAFFWMAAVVFIIFAKGKKIKFYTIVLNIL